MADESILSITVADLPPYALRGVTERMRSISGANSQRRTIFGTLVDLGLPSHRKYAVSLTCRDQQAPRADFIWEGQTVVVDCITELWYLTSGGSPERSVVSGSTRVDGTRTFYRPQLTMKITAFEVDTDEYGAEVGWRMELEEV
jgi:hypothetical protein